jgi:hypothetical protein
LKQHGRCTPGRPASDNIYEFRVIPERTGEDGLELRFILLFKSFSSEAHEVTTYVKIANFRDA